jgi:hypothetical protein
VTRLRQTVLRLSILLSVGVAVCGRPLFAETVDPEQIKATVQEVLAKGPYRLDPENYWALDLSWLFDLFRRLIELFAVPLSHAPFPVAMAISAALVIALIVLVSHIVYSFYAALKVPPAHRLEMDKDRLPNPDALETQAERLAAERNFVDATRTLFRAALVRLEVKRGGRLMSALTNSEYLRTFRTPWVVESLRVFVDLINGKWYRDRTFDEGDYLRCRGAYDSLHARLTQEES